MVEETDGEKLRLVCGKCRKEWEETRPKGYLVRYNKTGNFLVNRKDRAVKIFRCPKCGNSTNIGRLPAEKKKIKMHALRPLVPND